MAAFDFPSSPNVNDIYTLNGVAFMWNGSVWKRYSTSTGAQGFQGAAGAAGAQGAQGAQGTNGTIGSDGAQGAVGAQGAAGTLEAPAGASAQIIGAVAAANGYGAALQAYAANPTPGGAAETAYKQVGAAMAGIIQGVGLTKKTIPWENRGSMTDQRSTIDTTALFGEYYYQINDDLKLTLGARFMDDNYVSQSTGGLLDGASGYTSTSTDYETGYQESATLSDGGSDEEMFKVALQYDFLDDSMVYASAVTGIRPGGIEPTGALYDAEETTSLELGTRNILMDGRLKLNATYFSHETEGAQFSNTRGFSAYVEAQDFTQTGIQVQAEYNLTVV